MAQGNWMLGFGNGTVGSPPLPTGYVMTVNSGIDIYVDNTDYQNPIVNTNYGNPPEDGYVLSSTASGVRSWVEQSSGGGTGIVETIVAGENVTVDSTDPKNPIVSSFSESIDPSAYYKLDGSSPITGTFNGGGQKFSNALDVVETDDLTTLGQVEAKIEIGRF